MDYPELSNFIEILFNIMIYFQSLPCYQTSLLGYIYLLAKGTLPYEEECFHNFFLIDFSESPDTVEAIKHFRLDVKNGNVKFVFKDYDISLLDTFNVLIGKKDFIEFLQQEYSLSKIQRTNIALSSILSNL